MTSNPIELIDDMLNLLNKELNKSIKLNKDIQIIQWLVAQLKNLILDLESIKIDLEAGLSLKEAGLSDVDLQERLDEYRMQINNLKSAIRNCKEIA